MIQRIQTVYIALALILTVACLCMKIGAYSVEGIGTIASEYNLMVVYDAMGKYSFDTWPLLAVLMLSTVLGVYSIFAYNNRIRQARICAFNALLVVGWYVLYAVYSRLLVGNVEVDTLHFTPTPTAAFPLAAAVFYLLARRGIMSDERLVRSADRIR